MTWTAVEMPLCILRVGTRPNAVLVKQQILALSKSPEIYDRPRVIGELVTRGEATVIAAKRLGWGAIEVQKKSERQAKKEYDGPPCRPVWILEEVEPLVEVLQERLIEMLNGDGGPLVSKARALEFAIVCTLHETGFPGEAIGRDLSAALSLSGALPHNQPPEATLDPATIHVGGNGGPRRLSTGGGNHVREENEDRRRGGQAAVVASGL